MRFRKRFRAVTMAVTWLVMTMLVHINLFMLIPELAIFFFASILTRNDPSSSSPPSPSPSPSSSSSSPLPWHQQHRPRFIDTYERFDFEDAGEIPTYLAKELAAAAYRDIHNLQEDSYVLYDSNPPYLEGEAWQRKVAEKYGTFIEVPLYQVGEVLGDAFGFDERVLLDLREMQDPDDENRNEKGYSSYFSFKVPVMGVSHEVNQKMYNKSLFQNWLTQNYPELSPPPPLLLTSRHTKTNIIEASAFEDVAALETKLRGRVQRGEIPVPFILKPVEGSGGNFQAEHRPSFESQRIYPIITQEVLHLNNAEDDGAYRKSLFLWLEYFREKYGGVDCLVEGYIEGAEEQAYYFVVSRRKGVLWDFTKTYSVDNGVKIESSGVYGRASESLRDQFEPVLLHIGMHGAGCINYKVDPSTGQPKIFEINPRKCSGLLDMPETQVEMQNAQRRSVFIEEGSTVHRLRNRLEEAKRKAKQKSTVT